jgi:colanic acid biosynthesis glycosyl transferase WcaI
MRILFLSTYFKPDIASTGVLMTHLAEDLAELGHEVTVVTSVPHYSRDAIWDEYKGKLFHHDRHGPIDVHRVYVYVPGSRARSMERFLNYGSFNALAVLQSLSARKHDVIFVPSPPLTNGLAADLISRVWRVPFVYNVQDIWPDVVIRAGVLTNERVIGALRRLEQYVYQRARRLTVISEGFRCNLVSKGVPEEKIEVIPNFFDTDFVRPLSRKNDFSAAHDIDYSFVLFGGNVGHSQGLETVLNAADRLGDLHDVLFLIVGNGAAKDSLQARAEELELENVRFLPFQPHETLPEMYASSDICLVPLRRGFTTESVPCKVFTITAAARPLIASVDEGSDTWRWVQRANCGLCVPPEDPHRLARAIRALYSDEDLRKRLGESGRDYVTRHHTREVTAGRYHTLLSEVVQSQTERHDSK